MSEDVVILYGPPWHGPTQFSKHHLARYFACRGRRVLYVEAPLSPLGLRRGRAFVREFVRAQRHPERVSNNLWVKRYALPVPYHALTPYRLLNRLGQRALAPFLRADLKRLGFHSPLLIAGLPQAVDVLPFLPCARLIYHCADDYASVSGFPPGLHELEAELCRAANVVITTSETLCEQRRPFNARTYWIPNGADIEHFSVAAPAAPELANLPRPVIGFVGGLSEWVDLELVASLARERPAWSFALVGPASIALAPVRSIANVHLLGPRPYADLPRYLAGIDVGVIPFKQTPVTYHADPIKAYEYLAAGLPVVSTDLPAVRRLGPVVRRASTPADWLGVLDAAVAEGRTAGAAERIAEAARHSWSARFAEFERLAEGIAV